MEQNIIIENTRLYQLCLPIIALNAPSMIEEKTPLELYQIACRGGPGSQIAIKKLKEIYPENKMTDETIRQTVNDYYKSVTNTRYQRCGPIEFWDVSEVTDMSSLFQGFNFNEDLSQWDVSSVTTMNHMFCYCRKFNRDLSKWDVSSVTNMSYMFCHCNSFNRDLSQWDVSSVTNMDSMFYNCNRFNSDLSQWLVSSVTNMDCMFYNCSHFNS